MIAPDLDARLRAIASTPVLLVAIDFDGTLSPIVARPDLARPEAAAMEAVSQLVAAPSCHVAILSGRPIRDLDARCDAPPSVHLVGSHGAEIDGRGAADLPDHLARLVVEVQGRLDRLGAEVPGSLVEHKPFGATFHTRTAADRALAARAPELVASALSGLDDLHVLRGHEVVEVTVVRADKGLALDLLRQRVGATAVCFLGDDVTDERGFERLGPDDLGVKVGDGPTAAVARVASQGEVSGLLRRLADLRSAAVGGGSGAI